MKIFSRVFAYIELFRDKAGETIGDKYRPCSLDYDEKFKEFYGIDHFDKPIKNINLRVKDILLELDSGTPMFFAINAECVPSSPQYFRNIHYEVPILILCREDKKLWLADYFNPLNLITITVEDWVQGISNSGSYTVYPLVANFKEPTPERWIEVLLDDLPDEKRLVTMEHLANYIFFHADFEQERQITEYKKILFVKIFQDLCRSYATYPLALYSVTRHLYKEVKIETIIDTLKQIEEICK